MLLSARVALPREVWAHGYVQWEGTKMSKSAGTAVSLGEAIERHGPDALRYFLLREVGFEADGNFTWDRFDERYTADLADGLGNLASRSLAMVAKYRGGVVPYVEVDSPDNRVMPVAHSEAHHDFRKARELPPTLPSNPSVLSVVVWSLNMRLFARHTGEVPGRAPPRGVRP